MLTQPPTLDVVSGMPNDDEEDSRHSLPEGSQLQVRVSLMENRLEQLLQVVTAHNDRARRTEQLVEKIAKSLSDSAKQ